MGDCAKLSLADNTLPSSSSLSRLIRAAGMERKKRLQLKDQEQNLKFDFENPLECVQADGLYTVEVPDGKGKRRQAVLLAMIDDATRRVVFSDFGFSENALGFECGIKHILLAHGRIGMLYADNGSAFISGQTQRILDILGIVPVHSRPGKPAGRGKIERFFRTARDQFFRTLDVTSLTGLEDLRIRFHTWLESEYHRTPHRGLGGKTPLEAWLEKCRFIRAVDPGVNLDLVFLHEAGRKVHKDSTVTIDGLLYEVPSTLTGERILLSYDPFIPPERRRLQVLHNGHDCGEARLVDSYANARVRRGQLRKTPVIHDLPKTAGSNPLESASAPSPLDAGLSASRISLDQASKEAQE